MRAAVFHGIGRPLVIQDVPDPEPGPAEMVLAVRDCGICGSDLHFGYGKRDFAFEALRTDKSRVKVMLEPR